MIDWSLPIRTKGHGFVGKLQFDRAENGKRRVMLMESPPEYLGIWSRGATIYHYPEDGVCRCDGQPGPFDLENFD